MAQAVRATDGKVPVIPFIWPYCEGGPCYEEQHPPYANNETGQGQSHVSDAMIRSMIEVPYEAGAAATLCEHDRLQATFLTGLRSAHRWRCVPEQVHRVCGG